VGENHLEWAQLLRALQRRQEHFLRSPDAFAAACRQQGLGVPEVRKMSDALVHRIQRTVLGTRENE